MMKTIVASVMIIFSLTMLTPLGRLLATAVQSQERLIPVELTQAQWNAIAKAMSKEPFGEVVTIMSELQRQVGAALARDAGELGRLKAENEELRGKVPPQGP